MKIEIAVIQDPENIQIGITPGADFVIELYLADTQGANFQEFKDKASQDISDLKTRITQETTAREQDDETLDGRITANAESIEGVGNYINEQLPLKATKKELTIALLSQLDTLREEGVFTLVGTIKGIYTCTRDGSIIFQMVFGYSGIILNRVFDSNLTVIPGFTEYISSGGGGGDTVIANNLFETIPGKALDATQGTTLKRLVDGKIPCVILESIYLPPVDFATGQFYYNAIDNKIYLNAAGSGIEDWTSLAPGQIFKFQNSYWTFSSRLSLIGSGDVTTSPVPFVVGQVVEEVNKVAYIFQPTDAGYSATIQKGFMVHTPANVTTRTWQAAMDLTATDNSWRLPTKAELLKIYANKAAIGEFDDLPYWTSTDANSEAYCVNMGTGAAELHLKSGQYQSRNVFYFENYLGGVNEGDIAVYSDETGKKIKGSGKKFFDFLEKSEFVGEFATQKVAMAERDKNGNDIPETYSTKAGQEVFAYALSDIDSAITTDIKQVDTIDSNFQLTDILLSLKEAATGGIFTVNIKKNGVSIFTTKITIDATETSNLTAANPYIFATTPTLFVIGDRIEISIDAVGAVASGKGCTIKGKGIK